MDAIAAVHRLRQASLSGDSMAEASGPSGTWGSDPSDGRGNDSLGGDSSAARGDKEHWAKLSLVARPPPAERAFALRCCCRAGLHLSFAEFAPSVERRTVSSSKDISAKQTDVADWPLCTTGTILKAGTLLELHSSIRSPKSSELRLASVPP